MNSRPSRWMARSSAGEVSVELERREMGCGREAVGSVSDMRMSPSESSSLIEESALRISTCMPAALGVGMRWVVLVGVASRRSSAPLQTICLSQPGPSSSRHCFLRSGGALRTRCLRAQRELRRSLGWREWQCSHRILVMPCSSMTWR